MLIDKVAEMLFYLILIHRQCFVILKFS